jgi:hypothetical protein
MRTKHKRANTKEKAKGKERNSKRESSEIIPYPVEFWVPIWLFT